MPLDLRPYRIRIGWLAGWLCLCSKMIARRIQKQLFISSTYVRARPVYFGQFVCVCAYFNTEPRIKTEKCMHIHAHRNKLFERLVRVSARFAFIVVYFIHSVSFAQSVDFDSLIRVVLLFWFIYIGRLRVTLVLR